MTLDTGSTIGVTILLFAAFREAVGQRRVALRVPAGISAGDLFELLSRDVPALEDLRAYTSFAVNREVCHPTRILGDGDEIAFLQPASGGSDD